MRGMTNNQFLMLALAQTTIYQTNQPSIGSAQFNQAQIGDIIKIADESLYNPQTKSALTKITKTEAAAINGLVGNLYSQLNADTEANNRRWIERFLKMKPEERDSYDDDDLILLTAPKETVLRSPTSNERRFDKNESEHKTQQESWQKTDNIGAPQPVKTDHRTGELFQKSTDTYEKEEWKIGKKRGKDKGYQPKVSTTLQPNDYKPYSVMNRTVDAHMAIFSLYLEAAKYQKFAMRMAVITKYLNEKERLEKAIRNERVRLKPPPPEITLNHIKEFQRYGRITANPFEKRQIGVTLRQLYMLLEEGYAYYK